MFIKFVARLVDMGSDKTVNWKMSVTTSRAQEKLTNSKPHRESCTRGPKHWHFSIKGIPLTIAMNLFVVSTELTWNAVLYNFCCSV